MRILLVNPADIYRRDYWVIPPISLGYVATGLRAHGYEDIHVWDLRREGIGPEDLPRTLHRRLGKVDVVGINLFSPLYDSVVQYCRHLKKAEPYVATVAGGPHPIFEPEDTLGRNPFLDFAVTGEGEETFPKLMAALGSPQEWSVIPGLAYRREGRVFTNSRSFIQDLSKYPMPAWDLLDLDRYPLRPLGFFAMGGRYAPMIATRGCPYKCTYCGAPAMSGRKIRLRPVEQVLQEIDYLITRHNVREVHFLDDNLTLDRNYADELFSALRRARFPVRWACPNGVRLDRLTPELVRAMEAAGCYSISVGIESGSERVLRLMVRNGGVTSPKFIRTQVDMVKQQSRLRITGYFILGFPGSTRSDDEETIRFARSLNIDRAAFNSFSPLPGSTEYERLKSERKTPDPSRLVIYKVTYVPYGRSYRELRWLKIKSLLVFYLRFRILRDLWKEVKSFHQIHMIFKRVFA